MESSFQELTIFYASPERDADLLYWGKFRAPDAFLAFEIEKKRFAVLSSLEFGRAEREAGFDEVLALEELISESGARNDVAGQILFLAERHKATGLALPEDFPARIAFELEERGEIPIRFMERPVCRERIRKTREEERAIGEVNGTISHAFAAVERILAESTIDSGFLRYAGEALTSEKLRRVIAIQCLERGCLAEGTIVAAGDQACDPHERGTGRIPANSLIIVDIFPRDEITGYFGDMTRTYLKGRASPEQRKLVEAVREAQRVALDRLGAGVDGMQVHQGVVKALEERGFSTGKNERGYYGFFHGTGHGLGLEIHEEPRVSRQSYHLETGMVTTVEPGLYYPGLGGCRIEDVVAIREEGIEMLSHHPLDWEID